MSRFNLIDEKWIPVRFHDGDRDELGIRDTLLRAEEIAAIEDSSPLVVAALHRFLLAVLYRALEGPTDIDQAKDWFKSGLPSEKITTYLNSWAHRFSLFDKEHPFFQVPDFEPKKWNAWTVLAAEHNTNQAKVLFDHIDVTEAGNIQTSAAACWLLAAQTFAFTGNSELGYASFSPSANAAMVIPIGNNLEDTLLLSLIEQNREVMKADIPIWEAEPDSAEQIKRGVTRQIMGNVQLYTWPSRSIRLSGSETGVSKIAYAAGVKILGSRDEKSSAFTDPMLAYRIDEEKGHLPIQFSDRGLWREFHSLLPGGDIKKQTAPRVIQHAIQLTRQTKERFPKSFMALGLSNVPGQAKINYWRMERFALPDALTGDRFIHAEIRQLLKDSDDAQKSLWSSCSSFARDLLSRGDRNPDTKDIKKFVTQMSANPWYWSTLESRFHGILREYTLERDSEDIRCQWLKSVRDTLMSAWAQHRASVSTGDAWSIRALVKAEGPVLRKFNELNDEILKLEPQKEAA